MGYKDLGTNWNRKWLDDIKAMLKEIYDGKFLPDGSIGKNELEKNSVDEKILGDGAVTNKKIANYSIDSDKVIDGAIDLKKINPRELVAETIVRSDKSRNIFNKHVVTFGYYIANWDGNLVVKKDFACLKVPITPQKKLKLTGTTQQIAFFKQDGTYISGMESVAPSDVIEPPKDCAIIGVNCRISELDRLQLEYGEVATPYVPFGGDMVKTLVSNYSVDAKTVITVSKDGTKDYKRLRDAIEVANDSSAERPYEIKIFDGIYKLEEEYSVSEINQSSFLGYMKNDYVTWTGVGNVIVSASLDVSKHNDVTTKRVSTVNFVGNGNVTNISFIGKNVRYAIHDDLVSGALIEKNKNAIRKYENVNATKLLGDRKGYPQALGGGLWSGMQVYWKNSKFYSEWDDVSFSYHNNVNFSKQAILQIENCDFKSKSKNWSVRFGEVGSGTDDELILINNNIQSGIWIFPESSTAKKINFKLSGSGNSNVPIRIDLPSGSTQQVTYNVNNTTEYVQNVSSATIKKGEPVYKVNPGTISKMANDTPNVLFCGIAFEDIKANEFGYIKIGGYMERKDLTLPVAKNGDLLGIKNGQISVVQSSEYYFAYVFDSWFVKFV